MNFQSKCKNLARQLSYTEYDAEEMATQRAGIVGKIIDNNLEEPRLDELCSLLDLDTSELDNPAVKFTAKDVALSAWSNWGAGSYHRAYPRSSLTDGEFIVLNDYFNDIYNLDN